MLDWKNLTGRQRFMGSVFVLFALATLILVVTRLPYHGVREVLAAIAVCSFMLGILLNPDSFRGHVNPLSAPKICKALYIAAVCSLVLRGLLGVLGIQ